MKYLIKIFNEIKEDKFVRRWVLVIWCKDGWRLYIFCWFYKVVILNYRVYMWNSDKFVI